MDFRARQHESCNRAGQGWWRLLDWRPPVAGRDCNDPANDDNGDYSEPYAVPVSADTRLVVFDSSRVGVAPLRETDPMFRAYAPRIDQAFALASGFAHSMFVNHHPILGFAPDTTRAPDGVYPGNASLQSVLTTISGQTLFPANTQMLLAGHDHLFEIVSFSSAHPVQLISGNGGAWADAPLPRPLPAAPAASPGAIVESVVATNRPGFATIEHNPEGDGAWRLQARDRHGEPLTTCLLLGRRTQCTPSVLQ